MELSARIVYFQQKSEYKLGLFYGIEKIRNKINNLTISKINEAKLKEDSKIKSIIEEMGFADIIKKRGLKACKVGNQLKNE